MARAERWWNPAPVLRVMPETVQSATWLGLGSGRGDRPVDLGHAQVRQILAAMIGTCAYDERDLSDALMIEHGSTITAGVFRER